MTRPLARPVPPGLACGPRAVLTLTAALSIGCVSRIRAAAEDVPRPGSRDEVVAGLSGSYSYNEDDREDREALELRLEAGSYAAPEHEFGAWLLGRYTNRQLDADSSRDVWGGVHYRYHVALGDATSLFLGPTVGWSIVDTGAVDDDGFGYGAQLGVRHWLSESAAFTVTPTYFRVDGASSSGGDSSDLVAYWGVVFRW